MRIQPEYKVFGKETLFINLRFLKKQFEGDKKTMLKRKKMYKPITKNRFSMIELMLTLFVAVIGIMGVTSLLPVGTRYSKIHTRYKFFRRCWGAVSPLQCKQNQGGLVLELCVCQFEARR